jgi:ankyrin repeat protein
MKSRNVLWCTVAALCMAGAGSVKAVGDAKSTYAIVRNGKLDDLKSFLNSGASVNDQDEAGNTLLINAALYGSAEQVKYLLAHGANVNATNNAGVTALMRAAGDNTIVKLLVDRGADVNARSGLGNTPLILSARSYNGAEAVALLLECGAEVKATNNFGASAILTAAASGNLKTVKLLLDHSADPNSHAAPSQEGTLWGGGRTPLMWAAFRGDLPLAKLLVKAGARVNEPDGFGSALTQAAWADRFEMAHWLVEQGADVNARDRFSQFTPLHWAALTESGNADLVSLLIKKGADVNAEGGEPIDAFMSIPQTPLMLASKRGDTPITRALLAAGARAVTVAAKEVNIPSRELPAKPDAIVLRAAIDRAVPLLQQSALTSKKSFVTHASKQDCVSCHQQYLPMTAVSFARKAGAAVDRVSERELIEMVRKSENALLEISGQTTFHPEPVHSYGYGLMGLNAANEPATPAIDANIHALATIQGKDGQWYNNLPRPPIQTSDISATALGIYGLKKYPFPAKSKEFAGRVSRARAWLWKAKPLNTEERVYQLLGLAWSGENSAKLQPLAASLIAEQRADGGWAQLRTLEADAYATGQALFALRVAAGYDKTNPAIERGINYLLKTQLEDGSWFVARRAFPFQPTMKSGFPHSRDSWISSGGTSWATMALSLALPEPGKESDQKLTLNKP